MQRIKIKLPFKNETIQERRHMLIEVAEILSDHQFFTIIEERHFSVISFLVIWVRDDEVKKNKNKFAIYDL